VFSFGFRVEDILSVLPVLSDLATQYSIRYVIVANPESDIDKLREVKASYDFVDLYIRPLPLDELYSFLHASDVLLIHRESSRKYKAVISSSVCQALGSGCPILFHDSNYVELHGDEILKYVDSEQLKDRLAGVINNKFDLNRVKAFLQQNESARIAERFLELFDQLMTKRLIRER
jgi:hypothetical protein